MSKHKTQKIFITGGMGFIGSSLVSKLKKLGHEVASYDAEMNFINKPKYYQQCLKLRKKHFLQADKNYQGDIRDKEKLAAAVKDFKPDVIVHLAALAMARPLQEFASEIIPILMYGTFNVLDVFEKSQAKRLVYTSSSMAYGHFKQTPQSENFILEPINAYGASKAAGEYFVKLSQKEWVIVRPTSVYGFCDAANRVTQILIDAAFRGKPAWVVKGESLDFSYVEDVAAGFVKCITMPEANHETFNISTGESRAASEFAEILKKYFPKFKYEIREPTSQQVWRGPLDIAKAKKVLAYKPKYNIEKGIAETIKLIKKYNFYNY